MSRLERLLWTGGALAAAALALYTITLPEEDGRALWGGSDPVAAAGVGLALLAGCAVWAWRMATRRND